MRRKRGLSEHRIEIRTCERKALIINIECMKN